MTFGLGETAAALAWSAIASTATTAVSAGVQRRQAKKQTDEMRETEGASQAAKISEQRKGAEEKRMAGEPLDVDAIEQAETSPATAMGRVNLNRGIDPNRLRLGINALLGEGGTNA